MADSDQNSAQFSAAVDEYLTRAYNGDRRRKFLESGGWEPSFAAELADLGWYALAVPESHGGLGAPLSELGPVFMQFGRHLVVGPLLEDILLPAMLQRPDDWNSAPAVAASVETGVPLALVDPGVTTDWAEDLGSVTLSEQQLTGTVNAVRFARQASLLVVVAEADTGSAVCLVDPTDPGVRIEDLDSADPATEFARVVLSGVRADGVSPIRPADNELVARIRSWARLLIACELSGVAQRSLEHTVEYLTQREQFDRPIGSFQAVKHIAADMHARSAGLKNLCLASLATADRASVAELDMLAATAKAHAAEAAVRVCEDAIQLHGGMGFTTESDVSWYYKHALALRGWYGDETELRQRIGAALLASDSTADSGNSARDVVPNEPERQK
ncbi:acyl-CoA dehydrogenase family protein [Rhodococcus sp. WAY2]|uniref:acyl-CoA dehydrogenase family protein n=1 Tax=Rhodococcus sp. WAY2 TaxID=2663121 RepID=UPI00131FF00A|nr:acyl-CoA dehydrogenase family protein [Rhodococcus sp. WAY2]QHE66662.1 putative acyl-CoA dehydrogenase [Rhodococcus sp. WAY2]